jgi:predicted outer membrane repeat protein
MLRTWLVAALLTIIYIFIARRTVVEVVEAEVACLCPPPHHLFVRAFTRGTRLGLVLQGGALLLDGELDPDDESPLCSTAIQECTFAANRAEQFGGALRVTNLADLTLVGNNFTNNTVNEGCRCCFGQGLV